MMARNLLASEDQESLRPLTQALVGTIEILLDEIAALRNYDAGPWAQALEERVMSSFVDLKYLPSDAQGTQVAQSALRACFRDLRTLLAERAYSRRSLDR